MTTLAATYASLADALATRQDLIDLRLATEDIALVQRQADGATRATEWLERALEGWPLPAQKGDVAQSLIQAGVNSNVARCFAQCLESGQILLAVHVERPTDVDEAGMLMSAHALMPDLVGDTRESRQPVETAQKLQARARRRVLARESTEHVAGA